MAIHTFAAIYIGSYEVSLKIFEISPKRKINAVNYVRRRLELGRDAYSKGEISYEFVEMLCGTLEEFTGIMKEYRVDDYKAYVASALRDVRNGLFVLDQIKIRTGLLVHVLSNSEHRFISIKSAAMGEKFEHMIHKGAAVVDVGGGGLQITIFSDGELVTTQHLAVGTLRMQEQFAKKSNNLAQYELQIRELVEKELQVFQAMHMETLQIKYLIVIGDYIVEMMRKMNKDSDGETVNTGEFVGFLEKLDKKNLQQIAEELDLSYERDLLIIPYMMIFKCIAQSMGAEKIWTPGVTISDGIAYDYAEKNKYGKVVHDFDTDILAAAKNLSARYRGNSPHTEETSRICALIFDAMKQVHGLGKRERLLLQTAALLHDCGKYMSLSDAPKCSYNIIMASEILGLTHLERELVADTVLYNTYPLPTYETLADRLSSETYLTAAKLSAILRVANAMDRSHKQKLHHMRAVVKDRELVLTVETEEDLGLEKALFDAKSAYFKTVFGIGIAVRVKYI